MSERYITSTEVIAAARMALKDNGFTEITQYQLIQMDKASYCLFEDNYCVAAIVFYDTWSDLKNSWQSAQTAFVELLSEHIAKDERKSWDGYLLLWTPDLLPNTEMQILQKINYDVGRVRKIVSTGNELKHISSVESVLLPLLPLSQSQFKEVDKSALAKMPDLLASENLSKSEINAVITAFERHELLVEALYELEEKPS